MKICSYFFIALASGAISASVDDCPGYTASNVVESDSKLTSDLTLAGKVYNIYGTDLTDLKLLVEYQTNSRLHVKIYDADLQLTEKPFSFPVPRTDSEEVLFNTNGTKLIFESQYVHLRTQLPKNPNLYGFGEHSDSFRLPTDNYRRTLWNAESSFSPRNSNLYGSHPNYPEHRGDSGSHGVALLNANGMDININKTDSGDQFLEYNILGGVLDFYFLTGPSPTDVSKQYAEVVGLPVMVSYWTFGFQQWKYGWPDIETKAAVIANYPAANIPLEVLWADINYMDPRQIFTTDPEKGQKYVMILDPGVHYVDSYASYSRGKELDAFIKAADGSLYHGTQWAGEVVWPDSFAAKTQAWWARSSASSRAP
ncbi:galactose mutarotase-like domain-containing protein [Xylaria cf. heliscus]|nr:galactose mutarotase-like domain-containing protein [Xylaria cf. heliscus]